MIQIDVRPVLNQGQANEILRDYPRLYSKRKIINVSMTPIELLFNGITIYVVPLSNVSTR